MPTKKPLVQLNPHLSKSADEYMERLGDWRGEVIRELRALVIKSVPKAKEEMAWGQLVFRLDGPFCFIKAFRNQVNLGFWRGDQLVDPLKLLEKSVDQLRFVKVTSNTPIKSKDFAGLVKTAAMLNREHGDPTKHW